MSVPFSPAQPPSIRGNCRCYSRDEAARLLSVSSRTLYERTAPRGPIQPLRMGRRVLYPAAELQRFIEAGLQRSRRQSAKGANQ